MFDIELLKKLANTYGPSGNEVAVRKIIQQEIRPYVDECRVNKLGNLIARKKGKGERVMLAAHMDEVALMVKKIDESGYIRLSPVGGTEPVTLIGQVAKILKPNGMPLCTGIISYGEVHEGNEIKELPKIDYFYVDTGLSKEELKKKGVRIGTYVVPTQNFNTLGNKDTITGKALDDRIGCYILIELAKVLKKTNLDVYFVFSVQEEIGLYGAKTSVYEVNPRWGIAVDVTIAADSDLKNNTSRIIGTGPFLTVKDSEIIASPVLDNHIEKVAEKNKIPLNLEIADFGTTDATNMMLHGGGVPSTILGVAIRNIHTTAGIASMKDIRNCIKLLKLVLETPPKF